MDTEIVYRRLGQILYESGIAAIFDLQAEDLIDSNSRKLQEIIGFLYQAGDEYTFSRRNQKKMRLEGERHLGSVD